MEKIKPAQLINLTRDCKEIINDYMAKHDLSIHAFTKLCKLNSNQLYLFLNDKRGLNITTMQRIAEIVSKEGG